MTKKKILPVLDSTAADANVAEQPIPVQPEFPSGDDRPAAVKRRGAVDPTTCNRLYSNEDLQFMTAMDQYKRENRRPFPTWSEALEVLNALGYRKVAAPTPLPGMHVEVQPKRIE